MKKYQKHSLQKNKIAQNLLTSIKKGLEDVKNGKTKPINDLWKELKS